MTTNARADEARGRLGPGIRSVLRNSGYVLSGYAVTTLVAFGYAVVLARVLGKARYGTLVYGFSWYLMFIALSYLGLDVVLGREIGRDRASAARLTGSTLALRIAAATTVAVLSSVIGALVEPDATARTLLLMFAIALVARAVWVWCASVFAAFEQTKYGMRIDLICRPAEPAVAALVFAFVAPHSVIAVGVVHVAVWCVQAIIGLFTVRRTMTTIDWREWAHDARRLIVAGAPGALYAITVVWFAQAPVVIFRGVSGTGAGLSHFALAIQVLGYLLTTPFFLAGVTLPVLARSAARRDGKTRTVAMASVVAIPLIGSVIAILGMWFAPAAAQAIFGAQFRDTGVILSEALWLIIPMSLAISLEQVIFSHGRHLVAASFAGIVGMAAMAASFVPFTNAWGYHGALLATGIGMAVWAAGLIVPAITLDDVRPA